MNSPAQPGVFINKKTILEKLSEWIREIVDAIKELLEGKDLNDVVKSFAKKEIDRFGEIRGMFLEVLDEVEGVEGAEGVKSSDKNSAGKLNASAIDDFYNDLFDDSIKSFGIRNPGDYVQVQKRVFNTLKIEEFFTDKERNNRFDVNEETGMVIETNKSGIDETFNFENYAVLGRHKKAIKLATIRKLPEIIKNGKVVNDKVPNHHRKISKVKFAYIESIVKIKGIPVTVKIDIKKSPQKNKFWVHRVDITENANGFPADTSKVLKQGIEHIGDEVIVSNHTENVNDSSKNSLKQSLDWVEIDEQNVSLFEKVTEIGRINARMNAHILRIGSGLTRRVLSEVNIQKIARQLKGDYMSTVDIHKLTKTLTEYYQLLESGTISGEAAKIYTENIRDMLLNESKYMNPDISPAAKETLKEIKSTAISLNETQWKEVEASYGSRAAFRKVVGRYVKITKDGLSLDSRWQELSGLYPYLFDADVTDTDQPMRQKLKSKALPQSLSPQINNRLFFSFFTSCGVFFPGKTPLLIISQLLLFLTR